MNGELSLIAAISLGALHSLEPGHGKGVMSAYIISSRANAVQSIFLGIISSLAHALSIFLLATIATLSINIITPDHIIQWLEFFSGLVIVYIGSARLVKQYRPAIITVRTWNGETVHTCDHDHHHFHPNHTPTNLLQFFSVGFLTGIIPCPSALAIILAAISSHQTLIGVKLVIAFSIGGATTMASLGYLMSQASQRVNKTDHLSFIRFINILSALLIILLGSLILVTAIKQI